METKKVVEIDIDELRKAYEDKLKIAVDALSNISDQDDEQVEWGDAGVRCRGIATKALEEMRDKEEDTPEGITYKFVKMENRHSRYEIEDAQYGTTWSTLLSPMERGDLLNTIKTKVRILRQLHDKSTPAPN